MKLKHLEINGFKSFRDKVVLDFAPGISAVVGPNGCGKSNVVDAIRWVMGEQRIKSLRGVRMEDVIFNGSQEAEPVGMAEVTMLLAAEGLPFPEPYGDHAEVAVSRRLLRGGESEYTINGLSCRLLDVREFFLGAGVGARTYSIVEQNSVASLVEAKPEDRRQFIEEAAGIAKYKTRKEAALRKLDATKQNILRLNDILREVKSQLHSLSRQARRAEQYRNLKSALREDELAVAGDAYENLRQENEIRGRQLQDCRERKDELKAALSSGEALIAAARLELMNLEAERAQCHEEIYRLRSSLQVKEQGIEYSRGKIADLKARQQRLAEDGRLLKDRQEELIREREKLASLQQLLTADIAGIEADVRDREGRISSLKAELQAKQRLLEENKSQFIDVAAEKSRLTNNCTHLLKNLEDLKRKQDRNAREIEENLEHIKNLQARLKDIEAELSEDLSELEALRRRRETVTEEWEAAVREMEAGEETIAGLKEELSSRTSRLASLKELHDGYAWCNEATRSIMMAKETNGLQGIDQDQVVGLVAEQIRVPRDYEAAVEAVLGDKLQYVIVRSQEAGVKAIDYLKEAAVGRSSFVPLAVRHAAAPGMQAEHLRETERLLDRIEVRDTFRGIAEYLLGDVLLIPDLRNGLALWNRNGFRGTFVTRDGDMISPQGVLTGGSNGNGARSLLKNKREMETLEEEIRVLSASLREEGEQKKELAVRVAQGEEDIEGLTAAIHALELQRNGRQKDLERYGEEIRRLQQTQEILEFNDESQAEEQRLIHEKLKRSQADLESQKRREESVREAVGGLEEQVGRLRRELETLSGELTAEKVRQAALAEKQKSVMKSRDRLESEVADLKMRIGKSGDDARNWERQLEALQTAVAADKRELEGLYASLTARETNLAAMKDRYDQAEAALQEREARLRETKGHWEQVARQENELEAEAREVAYQMDGLVRMCAEKYQTDLSLAAPSAPPLSAETRQVLQDRIEKNRQSIAAFGEVNLLAITEYEQLKERFDFLTSQSRDLEASLATLQETIAKINRVSRQRFAATFTAVQGTFRDVFSRIFPGGSGELYLTDESDLLETGVDIDIRMHGKRPQNISLLSGGEKSLAAIALILAIILYRPTPFLVLDEVDAALDDTNISLIAKIIKEIAINSQVILITHNKRTMEVAENLFGVTMQKQGISTVVSVSLN
ncbi:MAG TPA: chromosome segregation protein SMC [Syntrophales bacterium]|nr:chromosome segregation protein SMC [Syntrophales bacterium]HON22691.1 chromosome segregation protein SMC [Syntrophales bacterium]HOU76719.1 chromosome segregation protein SMC [Syntrophales bacterium]HPC31842.1 chromosome segregation protein SMC [Syntrophales bacterium]HQJ30703.1 chromosome segregation protein SMC [Syntrophales bacterium]